MTLSPNQTIDRLLDIAEFLIYKMSVLVSSSSSVTVRISRETHTFSNTKSNASNAKSIAHTI